MGANPTADRALSPGASCPLSVTVSARCLESPSLHALTRAGRCCAHGPWEIARLAAAGRYLAWTPAAGHLRPRAPAGCMASVVGRPPHMCPRRSAALPAEMRRRQPWPQAIIASAACGHRPRARRVFGGRAPVSNAPAWLFGISVALAHICRGQFARVAKGVDLRSTAGNCAWARTPQLTQLTTASAPGHTSRCQAVLSERSLQRQPAPLPVAGPRAAAGHHQLAAGGSRLRHVTLDLTTRRCGPTGGS